MGNKKLIAYYQDQIAFYTKRMKRAEKNVKDVQSFGIPVDPLYETVYQDEKENVERYTQKLQHIMYEAK